MRSKAFLLILVFALAVCGAFTYSLLAETSAEIDIPFQKFVLPNGLTLIVHEDHKAPIVAVNVPALVVAPFSPSVAKRQNRLEGVILRPADRDARAVSGTRASARILKICACLKCLAVN